MVKNFIESDCRTDDWEINPKLLKVNESNVLGHGAFAVVYKGVLLGEWPSLGGENLNRIICPPSLNSTNCPRLLSLVLCKYAN